MAVTRAELERPSSEEGDPLAQRRLCAGMDVSPLAWLRPSLAVRTRFFDDQVMAAIARGIDQIVVAGAGYDDRALRFKTRGVTFYEIDHPSTQSDKLHRMQTMKMGNEDIVFAVADFRRDDVCSVLASAGHDAESASLFICEGVLVYLEQEAVLALLASLRACAAAKSTLAVSLATHPTGFVSDQVLATSNARRSTGETEPWRTILPADTHLVLLAHAGWQVESAVDAAELGEGVVEGRSLLVVAGLGGPETDALADGRNSSLCEDGGSGGRDPS